METDNVEAAQQQQQPAADGGTAQDPADGAADLSARLAEANARAEENREKLLYALADFENYKKRNERFLQDRVGAVRNATLAKFLPVLDNLQRALQYQADSDGLRQGLEATQRGFESLLAAENVKPLEVLGKPFDPRIAEAVGTRETDDVPGDLVVDEVQRGYTIGEEVLRPSQVIVSRRRSE